MFPMLLRLEEMRDAALGAEGVVMTTPRHLSTSRERFVFDAHETAQLVEQHLEALSAGSHGKIDAKTAPEMRALADRITQLHVAPRRTAGPVKPTVNEAVRLIRVVRAALATLDDPTLHEQLKQTSLSARRSIAQTLADLDTHATLLRAYEDRLRALLPSDMDAKLTSVRHALEGRRDLQAELASTRTARQSELQSAQVRLLDVMGEARRFLALLRRLR